MYLADLISIEEGVQNLNSNGLINFAKMRMVSIESLSVITILSGIIFQLLGTFELELDRSVQLYQVQYSELNLLKLSLELNGCIGIAREIAKEDHEE